MEELKKECFEDCISKKTLELRHDIVIGTIIMSIIKCILRYLLMAAYLYACSEFGLYNYGLIAKIVVTLTAICLSRWIMREIGIMLAGRNMDDPMFEDIGIVACVRSIRDVIGRW